MRADDTLFMACAGEPPLKECHLPVEIVVEKLETEKNQQPTTERVMMNRQPLRPHQAVLDGAHLHKVHRDVDDDRRPPCRFRCRSGLT
jgi:hypothetical protein